MAFTYDTATAIGELRLKLGDRTLNVGLRPDGANFSDEELQVFLDDEGTVAGALALSYEALANEWANWADLQTTPLSQSFSQISARWAERAKQQREHVAAKAGQAWEVSSYTLDTIEPEEE